ncbi:MAG: hypothetical protein WC087_00690 [Candidatus Paceibacterota bacterium]
MGIHNRKKQYGFASVQPRDAQIVNKERNKKIFIISGVVALLLIIVGTTFAVSKSDFDFKANIASVASIFKREPKLEVNNEVAGEVILDNSEENPSVATSGVKSSVEKVKLALLASPDLFDYKNNKMVGCDALVFAEAEIPATPKVLNATLELLFNDDFDYGFPPANFISSTQNKLDFDSAVIESGVAKIFLKGEMTIEDDFCDEGRIENQIKETALQFSTIKSVEIYLNGSKIEL